MPNEAVSFETTRRSGLTYEALCLRSVDSLSFSSS